MSLFPHLKIRWLAIPLAAFCISSVQAVEPATKPAAAKTTAATPAATRPAGAKPAAKSKPAVGKDDKAVGVDDMPDAVRQQMSEFIEKAVQAISPTLQTSDEFLPYGVMQLKDGTLRQVEWKQPNPPAAQEVLRGIFLTMMREAAQNPDVVAVVTVSPSVVSATTENGVSMQVHGLRAEADHREGAPRVAFMPYLREEGKLVFGTVVYQVSPNPLFDHGKKTGQQQAEKAGPTAKKPEAKPEATLAAPAVAPAGR